MRNNIYFIYIILFLVKFVPFTFCQEDLLIKEIHSASINSNLAEEIQNEFTHTDIDWVLLISELCGALALFLQASHSLERALREIAGDKLKGILATVANNHYLGVISGIVITGILQSSSVVTIMLVGFVSSGLMNQTQALGIILGMSIGTTLTGQIVAFKIEKWSMLMVAVGYISKLLKDKVKRFPIDSYGKAIMSLGLIFFCLTLISDSMQPLKTYPPFLELLTTITSRPLFGIFVSIIFTGILQSSTATIGIVITLAGSGLISVRAGLLITLGANVGTCFAGIIAALGKQRKAMRVALAHLLFKVVGLVLALPILYYIEIGVVALSGNDVARQVANFHSLFNIALAIGFFPVLGKISVLLTRMMPDKPTVDLKKFTDSEREIRLEDGLDSVSTEKEA